MAKAIKVAVMLAVEATIMAVAALVAVAEAVAVATTLTVAVAIVVPAAFSYCAVFVAASSLNIEIRSEGCDDPGKTGCGKAFIKVNNQDYSLHRRGFNVAVFTEQGM